MSFTSPHIIRGWFTADPSWHGRDGTRILEFGLAAPISRSGSVSESVGSEVMDGAGVIGDSIGMAGTQFITTTATIPGATPSITGATTTGAWARTAEFITVPAQPPGLSTETGRLLEDTLNPAVRAARARAHSAAMTMVDRPEAIRHAAAAVSVAAEGLMVAVVAGDGGNEVSLCPGL